jgi:UDP-glucose:(heptosyl)LPS alpha-1,3-glucosyltransferase
VRGRHRTFVALEQALLDGGGARAVVCVSELVRRELELAYPSARERLRVIENGIDLDRFHPRHRITEGARLREAFGVAPSDLLIAFVARQPRTKGLPQLFAALRELRELPWRLIVAGPKDPAAWLRLARRYGHPTSARNRRVWVERELDTRALFCAADLTAHPTLRDTSGLAVLESLACGTPVVTTRAAGAAPRVGDAGGVIDDARDTAALARALGEHLSRAAAPAVDRDRARERVADLSEARQFGLFERLFSELAPAALVPEPQFRAPL